MVEKEKYIGGFKVTAADNTYWMDTKDPIEIAKNIIDSNIFKNKWISSLESIEKQFEQFPPGKLIESLNNDIFLNKIFIYITKLSHIVIFNKPTLNYVSDEIQNEFERENNNGTLCAYSNVLMYLLIKRLYQDISLQLIQGFYRMSFPEKTFQRAFLGEEGAGLHAFLLLNETIIDPTIQQIGDNYSLGESEFIITGDNLPKNISMYGWREKEEVVNQYAVIYAKLRGLSLEGWLSEHEAAANKVMAHAIKCGDINIERNEICFCGSGKKFKKCHLIL